MGCYSRLLLVSTFASLPCGEWKNLLLYRCNGPSLAPGTPQSPGQLSASVEQGTIPTGLVLVRLLRGEGRPLHNKTRRRFSSAMLLLDDGDQAAADYAREALQRRFRTQPGAKFLGNAGGVFESCV